MHPGLLRKYLQINEMDHFQRALPSSFLQHLIVNTLPNLLLMKLLSFDCKTCWFLGSLLEKQISIKSILTQFLPCFLIVMQDFSCVCILVWVWTPYRLPLVTDAVCGVWGSRWIFLYRQSIRVFASLNVLGYYHNQEHEWFLVKQFL